MMECTVRARYFVSCLNSLLLSCSVLSAQSFAVPQKKSISAYIGFEIYRFSNGKFRFGAAINHGRFSTEQYTEDAKLKHEYYYEYTTLSGGVLYGSVDCLDDVVRKCFRGSIPTTESGSEFRIYRNGSLFYSFQSTEDPMQVIWKEIEPGRFHFKFDPQDEFYPEVVWNEGKSGCRGSEHLQQDGTFVVEPGHLKESGVLVIGVAKRGLRFKRIFIRPGIGEVPKPDWVD